MKRFLIKLIVLVLLLTSVYLLLVDKLSKGYVDMYYNKFTERAGSLILGLSRADQGIAPHILERSLVEHDFELPLVNFASNQSFYGDVYHQAITKKLKNDMNTGLFILSVTPGSFTAPKGAGAKEIELFDEESVMGKADEFASNPNYNYIMNCYGQSLYNSIYNTTKWENLKTHLNGWNELQIKSSIMKITDKDINIWKSQNISFYERKSRTEEFQKIRLQAFLDIVTFLKGKGKVFLVRLPADSDVIALENKNHNNFDHQMDSIAKIYGIPYLNYSTRQGSLKTYDGSHLESESAKKFTALLSRDIGSYIKGN